MQFEAGENKILWFAAGGFRLPRIAMVKPSGIRTFPQ
jgi:hypothetical protein